MVTEERERVLVIIFVWVGKVQTNLSSAASLVDDGYNDDQY